MTKQFRFLPGLLGLLLIVAPALAQAVPCPALVKQALAAVDKACSNLGRNEVCYGNNRIEATFDNPVELTFSQPSDRVPIKSVRTLRTFGLDDTLGLWGVALMNIQANLPDSLPGQSVKFILYGDVTLKNAGDDQAKAAATCPLRATNALKMRSGPGEKFNVTGVVQGGQTLQGKARSDDGTWVYTDQGWVIASAVTASCNVASDLKVYDASAQTGFGPMQAFYFTTGVGDPKCKEAPASSLVVQSPKGFRVSLKANGLDVNVGSTVAFQAVPKGKMRLATLQGQAVTVLKGKARLIPQGFQAEAPLGGEDGLEAQDGPEQPEFIDKNEWEPLAEANNAVTEEDIALPDTSQWKDEADFCADPANKDLCTVPDGAVPPDITTLDDKNLPEAGDTPEANPTPEVGAPDTQPTDAPAPEIQPTEVPPDNNGGNDSSPPDAPPPSDDESSG